MADRMTSNAMVSSLRTGWMAALAALVALLLLAPSAHAELNKCQDASGRVTYTDQACPSTSTLSWMSSTAITPSLIFGS